MHAMGTVPITPLPLIAVFFINVLVVRSSSTLVQATSLFSFSPSHQCTAPPIDSERRPGCQEIDGALWSPVTVITRQAARECKQLYPRGEVHLGGLVE